MARPDANQPPVDTGARLPIVVGVDGSVSSCAALAWAAQQARRTGSAVLAISTWEWPVSYGTATEWPAALDLAAEATETLRTCIEAVVANEPSVNVVPQVVEGRPSPVLEEASRLASLVVVGSRRHVELTGVLLGSVGEYLVAHVHCPVVIVRDDLGDGSTALRAHAIAAAS